MEKRLTEIAVNLMGAHFSSMISMEGQKKHCSAIVYDGEVIAVGFNRHRTSQIAFEFGYQYGEYHAELDALIQIHHFAMDLEKDKLSLINFRINRFTNIGISRPCSKCMRWADGLFSTFMYTDADGGLVIEDSLTKERVNVMNAFDLRKKLGWKESVCHA
jgi:hypothetical protein